MEESVSLIDAMIGKARGEGGDLGELLEWYRGMVLVWAYRSLDARFQRLFDPEDLVQEVLAKAVRGFGQFRGATAVEFTRRPSVCESSKTCRLRKSPFVWTAP
jgi:hypothetical protein